MTDNQTIAKIKYTKKLWGNKKHSFSLKKAKLVIIKGPNTGKTLKIKSNEIKIGSMTHNDLCLNDPTVSRNHAKIIFDSIRFIIQDLNSTNGVELNGIKIHKAVLDYGTIITIGNTQIEFQPYEHKIKILPSKENYYGKLYGESTDIRIIFSILKKISLTDTTLIIEGETGTGKDLLANTVHEKSLRSSKPFIIFDCGAVPPHLIESELFGHEKGAFTGANETRKGMFEEANNGTLFLDEIGELTLDLQPKLLRAIESRKIKRVGGNKQIPVNVRIIAATNRNLIKEIEKGTFREDLYYRLSILKIEIPPLRKRKEDLPILASNILKNLCADYNINPPPKIPYETIQILKSHNWPGNVRELKNIISRALALGNHEILKPEYIHFTKNVNNSSIKGIDSLAGLTLEEIEKGVILETLKLYNGNKKKVAKVLNIAYSTLFEKIKKYNLDENFKK